MWTCRKCGHQVEFNQATPEIDEAGCYFLCHECEHRNILVNVGSKDGPIELAQLDS